MEFTVFFLAFQSSIKILDMLISGKMFWFVLAGIFFRCPVRRKDLFYHVHGQW